MSTSDWLVILAGIAAIAWVNWYFLVPHKPSPRIDPSSEPRPGPPGPGQR